MEKSNSAIVKAQRKWFYKGNTLPLAARQYAITRLVQEVRASESAILQALAEDMDKGPLEAFAAEIAAIYMEAKVLKKELANYVRGEKRSLPFYLKPGRGEILPEPYGVSLIISPWNYPVELALGPALGALAAGNTVIIRPSQQLPKVAQVLSELVARALPPEWATVVNGEQGYNLYREKVDYVFFTGSTRIGSQIGSSCAERLIPHTLELGGKSPVIVTRHADLNHAARRIAFGKIFNAGQTCIAPDYVLVDEAVADDLVRELLEAFHKQFPSLAAKGFPKIIGKGRREKLAKALEACEERIIYGGKWLGPYLEPTLIYPAQTNDELMQWEIFAPVLPILTYRSLEKTVKSFQYQTVPLASYIFTEDAQEARYILRHLGSGGACVNDVMLHVVSEDLPFGGKRESGIGRYHGLESLRTFSHEKSVLWQSTNHELPLRYRPYPKLLEWLIRKR